ncbi:hypothetical protein SODG_000736 [Sodalis praecaptivus]
MQNFTERDRQAFLTWTGGEEVILQPGEAIYFPPFAWHFADYLDDCWALNLRFRRKDSITALLNCAFPDSDCQALGVLLLSTTLAPETEQDILTELARLTRRPFRDGRQKPAISVGASPGCCKIATAGRAATAWPGILSIIFPRRLRSIWIGPMHAAPAFVNGTLTS